MSSLKDFRASLRNRNHPFSAQPGDVLRLLAGFLPRLDAEGGQVELAVYDVLPSAGIRGEKVDLQPIPQVVELARHPLDQLSIQRQGAVHITNQVLERHQASPRDVEFDHESIITLSTRVK